MDRQELIEALKALDSQLLSSCDIILVGGAAMIMYFGAQRATRDIDVLIIRGDRIELRQAIKAVAHQRGLPEEWMNDAVKGFATILPSDFNQRLVSLEFGFQHLRLYVLGRPDQAAMKITALREQDLEDLELLLPQMSEIEKRTLTSIIDHVSTFQPDWAYKIQLYLEELGWTLD